ncbi:MAG: YfcE family phosphodiesterase [Anaerolineae bacterium]|nr:YfcE family phosphodiesterase [Anaerolineae bacterium]
MRIGLLSDTHNHRDHVKSALSEFHNCQVTTLLHAGDVTQPVILKMLQGFDVWIARGNMDYNPDLLTVAEELFGKGRMRLVHTLTFAGVRVALTHGDTLDLHKIIHSGIYHYVIHGHSHIPKFEQVGETWVINPGALGNTRWRTATCAILDLVKGDLEWVEV